MGELMKIIETYSVIIDLMKAAIDELFRIVCQYMTTEELDSLPCVKKINEAAKLKADIERGV